MNTRRQFIKTTGATVAAFAAAPLITRTNAQTAATSAVKSPLPTAIAGGAAARAYWVSLAERIAAPVLENLAARTLRKNMPVEMPGGSDRRPFAHLEAFGRLLSGIAPWIETEQPQKWISLAHASLEAATDPSSPDFMNFTDKPYNQPLVDASYVAMAFLRAPKTLWENLDARIKANVLTALKATRKIRANQSNWLMFAATIEAFMHSIGEQIVEERVTEALVKHEIWYVGDGTYGDGPAFAWDYYNGYVIQPMLVEVMLAFGETHPNFGKYYRNIMTRAQRYAEVQERLISPEGTYPPIGRSIVYRFGAFQPLAQMALLKKLPRKISPAQVRCAMTTMIRRQMEAPGTFDKNGWLTLGFCGHQVKMAEYYASTGSVYICANGLLALGLPASDAFWTAPDAPWTSAKAWGGVDIGTDHGERSLSQTWIRRNMKDIKLES